ncbi:hypothetical protein ACLUWI_03690 [Limosilactobacillus mucosae]|uniref:hypothetical protein n=1 Tax=Limosilactobacillus mucosae TaxID=97478 RepID=UPI0039912DDD
MVRIFFWLATAITLLFLLAVIILFVCNWIIYYRIEEMETHGPVKNDLTQAEDALLKLPPKEHIKRRLRELGVKSDDDQ